MHSTNIDRYGSGKGKSITLEYRNKKYTPKKNIQEVLPEERFRVCDHVTDVNMDVIPVGHIPQFAFSVAATAILKQHF